jgi:hypothetical protein
MFEHLFAKKQPSRQNERDQKDLGQALNGYVERRAEPRPVGDAADTATCLPAHFLSHTSPQGE